MRTIENPHDTSIISFKHNCSIFIVVLKFICLKGRVINFKIVVEGTYGCAGFRNELLIHIISHMMRVVVTDRIISRIANIRHVYMDEGITLAQLPLLLWNLWWWLMLWLLSLSVNRA